MNESDLKTALSICDELGLHINDSVKDVPNLHLTAMDTHYIMHGDKIIFVGNEETCASFVIQMSKKAINGISTRP